MKGPENLYVRKKSDINHSAVRSDGCHSKSEAGSYEADEIYRTRSRRKKVESLFVYSLGYDIWSFSIPSY